MRSPTATPSSTIHRVDARSDLDAPERDLVVGADQRHMQALQLLHRTLQHQQGAWFLFEQDPGAAMPRAQELLGIREFDLDAQRARRRIDRAIDHADLAFMWIHRAVGERELDAGGPRRVAHGPTPAVPPSYSRLRSRQR